MRLIHIVWNLFVCFVLFGSAAFSIIGHPLRVQSQSTQTPVLFYYELQTIYLTNLERRKNNVPPLRWNREMSEAARWFARDAVETTTTIYCDHFDSLGRGPGQRLRDFGYTNLGAWSENAVCGYAAPASAVRGWMSNDFNRQSILDPRHREIGLGYYRNAAGRGFVAQELSSDAKYAPIIINNEAISTSTTLVALYIYDQASGGGFTGVGSTVDMMVSNSPTFDGATWEPYTAEKQWMLEAGAGWHTVYVKTRDDTGRVTIVYDTIYLGDSVATDQLTLDYASAVEEGMQLLDLQPGDYANVELSANWMADDSDSSLKLLLGAGEKTSDPAARGGTAFRMIGGSAETYLSLWSADFFKNVPMIAYVRLKISDNGSPGEAVRVTISDGQKEAGSMSVRGVDFSADGEYQEFAFPFAFAGGTERGVVSIGVTRSGPADIFFDGITFYNSPAPAVTPLDWNAPGGYLRSSGIEARFSNSTDDFSAPIEVYPYLGRLAQGAPPSSPVAPPGSPIAPAQMTVDPTAITLMTESPAVEPAAVNVTIDCPYGDNSELAGKRR